MTPILKQCNGANRILSTNETILFPYKTVAIIVSVDITVDCIKDDCVNWEIILWGLEGAGKAVMQIFGSMLTFRQNSQEDLQLMPF